MAPHGPWQVDQPHYWLEKGWEIPQIEEELGRLGHTAEEIEAIVQSFKKVRIAKRQQTAFVWLGIGAVLGFGSCVWSIVNPIPALFHTILFGATTLAITLIVVGLYYLFE